MIRLDGGKMKKILFSMLLLIAFSFTQEVLTKKNINIDKNNLILTNHRGIDRIRFMPDTHFVETYYVDFGQGILQLIDSIKRK